MGIYTKVHFLCERRFWADEKLTTDKFLFGGMNSNGPLVIFADGSYPPTKGDPAMLVGFLIPPSADSWNKKLKEERRIAAGAEVHRMLDKRPKSGIFDENDMGPYADCEYHENRWEDDPWGKGVTVVVKSGTLHLYGSAFTNPQRRVHFAGSDTSSVWHGYMEGALASGERAAAEVAERLKTPEVIVLDHNEGDLDEIEPSKYVDERDLVRESDAQYFHELESQLEETTRIIHLDGDVGEGDEGEERFLARQHLAEAHELANMHRAYRQERKIALKNKRDSKKKAHNKRAKKNQLKKKQQLKRSLSA